MVSHDVYSQRALILKQTSPLDEDSQLGACQKDAMCDVVRYSKAVP